MKRAVLYLRVSTLDQTTANQERELRQVAERAGWQIVKVYKDRGISGAKGKDKRPEFDDLHKAAARREFDVVTVQRKLKDAGRFIFIDRVKKNPSFLPYFEPSLGKVRAALARLADEDDMRELAAIVARA